MSSISQHVLLLFMLLFSDSYFAHYRLRELRDFLLYLAEHRLYFAFFKLILSCASSFNAVRVFNREQHLHIDVSQFIGSLELRHSLPECLFKSQLVQCYYYFLNFSCSVVYFQALFAFKGFSCQKFHLFDSCLFHYKSF